MSSTYIDLREARTELAHFLQQVFGAELIIMETFGSDAAPPDVTSVARVRACDFFVGIYAHRYGTVDTASGRSMTALELNEARVAHSQGVIQDILLYVIDPNSSWLIEYQETDAGARAALNALKEDVSRHTYTRFSGSDDLFVGVLRDIYQRIHPRGAEPAVRRIALPPARPLARPMGMMFLTSPERQWLVGRQSKIEELYRLLMAESVTLLLGNSGVGKTSLVHAGLEPYATGQGLRVISTRPVGFPRTEVIRQLESSVFERPLPYHGTLDTALAEISDTLQQPILLILDQFEDVLASRDMAQIDALIADLRRVREIARPLVHVLISYRADMEARLGQFWQAISGAARGLPRVYLDGINPDSAWDGFAQMASGLNIEVRLGPEVIATVKSDMIAASVALGCAGAYPPHLQMFLEHVWAASGEGARPYGEADYESAGGLHEIIGRFLSHELEHVLDAEGRVRSVLVSLVRGYGISAQSTLNDIAEQTGFSTADCDAMLERLIDARLVRHVEAYYEVTHDLVAQHIVAEVLDPEEREFKRYRDLLAVKAASYEATGNVLTVEETLMLFKHRGRIRPSLQELRLILASWADQDVPGLEWLQSVPTGVLSEWLAAETGIERGYPHREWDASIVLLKSLLTTDPLDSEDYLHLREFQLAVEMASLIMERRALVPRRVILRGLRHRRAEVRAACIEAIITQMNAGDLTWLNRLRIGQGTANKSAYAALVLSPELNPPPADGANPRIFGEFNLLRRLATDRTRQSLVPAYRALQQMRPAHRISVFARGLTYVGTGRVATLLRQARRANVGDAVTLLGTVGAQASRASVREMVRAYCDWNARERAWDSRVMALGSAIRRAAVAADVPVLRRAVRSIRLTQSAREIVAALLGLAEMRDVELIVNRIGRSEVPIDFVNHTELGNILQRRMESILIAEMPGFLLDIVRGEEFRGSFAGDRLRRQAGEDQVLPLRHGSNRPLCIRLVAYAVIGASRDRDVELLTELVGHRYGLISQGAAVRLVMLSGVGGIERLIREIGRAISGPSARTFARSLRWAEIELWKQRHSAPLQSAGIGA